MSSDVSTGEWWHTLGAWQWRAQFAVAVLGFLAVAASLAWTLRGSYRRATGAMVVAAASLTAWVAFLAPGP